MISYYLFDLDLPFLMAPIARDMFASASNSRCDHDLARLSFYDDGDQIKKGKIVLPRPRRYSYHGCQ